MSVVDAILYFLIDTVNRQIGKMSSIPALGSLRQEDQGFRVSLGSTASSRTTWAIY